MNLMCEISSFSELKKLSKYNQVKLVVLGCEFLSLNSTKKFDFNELENIIENEAINITTLEETIDQVVFKENGLTWLAKTTSSINSNYFIENVNTTKDNTNIIDVKLQFKKVSNKTIDLSKYTKPDEIELL